MSVFALVFGTAMPSSAASLHGPLGGQSANLTDQVPTVVPGEPAGSRGGVAAGTRSYFEPEPHEPAAETCTFSLDVLCSDETSWLNRDVFGTDYRFDPTDAAQGAPSDHDLGLTVSSGLAGQGADGRSTGMESLSKGAVSIGAFSAD